MIAAAYRRVQEIDHGLTEAGVPNAGRGKGHHTFWQVAAAEDCIRAHVGLPTVCQHGGAK